MKHAVKGKQLNRDVQSRRALFKNLTLALIEHGHIVTTLAKANSIRSYFDKLVTHAKKNTVHARRLIDTKLNQRKAVNRLVDEIVPSIKRNSGFTRITKLGMRRGDAADMVKMEIIDWQPKVDTKTASKAKSTKKGAVTADTKKAATSSHDEKPVSKVKQLRSASTTAKHVPQKRISGGK